MRNFILSVSFIVSVQVCIFPLNMCDIISYVARWWEKYLSKRSLIKLERNLPENDSYKEEEKSADDTCSNVGEEVRDILTALEADEEIGNLEEEDVAIIEEIARVLERRQKDKLPALGDIQKKKLLEETAKVDKVLCNFKTNSITKTN